MRKTLNAQFEIKKIDAATGRFTGRASVYGIKDSYNDVVMPGAFTNTLQENGGRIRVLSQHDPSDPIGWATLTDRADALWAEGQLELRLQSAKDMLTRLETGLVDGISIGYETVDEAFVGGVRQLKEIKLWEISLVTYPALDVARITDVKANSEEAIAAGLLSTLRSMTTSLKANTVQAQGRRRVDRKARETDREPHRTA